MDEKKLHPKTWLSRACRPPLQPPVTYSCSTAVVRDTYRAVQGVQPIARELVEMAISEYEHMRNARLSRNQVELSARLKEAGFEGTIGTASILKQSVAAIAGTKVSRRGREPGEEEPPQPSPPLSEPTRRSTRERRVVEANEVAGRDDSFKPPRVR